MNIESHKIVKCPHCEGENFFLQTTMFIDGILIFKMRCDVCRQGAAIKILPNEIVS
jgi:predicted  nucleic acid-binding Zn ribbon protein